MHILGEFKKNLQTTKDDAETVFPAYSNTGSVDTVI